MESRSGGYPRENSAAGDDEIIPASAHIGSGAFRRSALKKVELCESVAVIGEKAFYEILNLEELRLPASLQKSGLAFSRNRVTT